MRSPTAWPRAAARALMLALALAGWALTGAAAPFEDNLAQRLKACTACHGEQGRAGPDGFYPRLAGKPAGYLYNQLLNFRDGRRHYGLMRGLIGPLPDEYLREIARHFAAQHPPHPAPAPVPPGTPQAVLERGREIATRGVPARQVPACTQCHGQALMGTLPATPGLIGLPRDYLQAQMGAWRAGRRQAHAPDCMARIVERLPAEDLSAVATWLAAQPVPPDARPADPEAAPSGAGQGLRCGSLEHSPGARP